MNRNLKPGQFYGEILRKRQASGLILSELKHEGARKLPRHSHELAYFCLLLNGNYWEQFGPKRISYKPLTVMFHPPGTTHSKLYMSDSDRSRVSTTRKQHITLRSESGC